MTKAESFFFKKPYSLDTVTWNKRNNKTRHNNGNAKHKDTLTNNPTSELKSTDQ